MARSISPVNLAAVADVQQKNPALSNIELVKHSVIAHTQAAFRPTCQAVMGVGSQSLAHFIHPVLDGDLNLVGQTVVLATKSGRPDLQRGRHGLLRLAGAKLAGPDFLPRLIEFAVHLVSQFQLILAILLKPGAEVGQFLRRKSRDGTFQFLHRTHSEKIA
jgi:hypothetical protein